MTGYKHNLAVALAIISVAAIILSNASGAYGSDAEMDILAARFASSLGSVDKKLGADGSATGPMSASEADTKMRELYSSLEKVLTEARQTSANIRSALVSEQIEKLRV